jgi:outer membrane protein insertion porin family
MRIIVRYYFLFILLLTLHSCSTKSVPAGDSLYRGAHVKIEERGSYTRKDANTLAGELSALTRPRPNTTILGLPVKLWLYTMAGHKPRTKGIGKWIQTNLGEPPVLGSMVNLEKNRQILANRLENRGFFKATVAADTVVKRKKMTANYTAKLGERYKINEVAFPTDSSVLSQHIFASKKNSLLKVGEAYDLETILNERRRIDAVLKEEGFFYFNPEYLIINVDSTIGGHKVNLFVQPKAETPFEAREVYHIKDVIVFADYELNDDTLFSKKTTPQYNGYYIVDPHKNFNPQIFKRTLIFDPGDVYKRSDHSLTLNRLQTLGVYKFVKVRFTQSDTAGNYLDAYYYLTRLPFMAMRAEVSGFTKSNNANGSEVSISWKDRNLLKGAELLTLTAFVGAETQLASKQSAIATFRTGFDINMYVPRIIAPFTFRTNSGFVPKTRFNVGYELFNRNTQYTLTTFKGLAGYTWKESFTREHQLDLININYLQPANITEDFQKRIDTNITLRRTIERQFIIGSRYNFNYNSLIVPNNNRSNFYFNADLDASGYFLALMKKPEPGKKYMLFNAPISQYARIEFDMRHYWHLGGPQANQLASRIIIGSGWPYGNSEFLPFSKSFFIGGTNSLRGFRARSVGPGTYYGGTPQPGRFLPDQPGDIKLEINTELRAKLISIMNGAVFVDAGNIWTRNEDPERPGSAFTSQFLKQLAVNTGVGLRFDLSFIVLRFDLGFPIRKPYLPGGPRWVIKDIDFGNSAWRRENLIFNLAIGYPF